MTLIVGFWTPIYTIIGIDNRFHYADGSHRDNAKKLFVGKNYVIAARGQFIIEGKQIIELDDFLNDFVSRHEYNHFSEMRLRIINELQILFENMPFDFQLLIAGKQPNGLQQSYIDFKSSPVNIIDDSFQENGIRLNDSIYNLETC